MFTVFSKYIQLLSASKVVTFDSIYSLRLLRSDKINGALFKVTVIFSRVSGKVYKKGADRAF